MIFAIQTYVEDYFNRRGLDDLDQYSVALAKLYDRHRQGKTVPEFLSAMRRIRTVFYRRNDRIERDVFDRRMLTLLDGRFKKKDSSSFQEQSPHGLRRQAAA
jgi:hypothetical protein